MDQSKVVIEKAKFSPKIKSYIMVVVGFFMLITIIGIPLMILWFLGIGQIVGRRYYENLHCRLTERHLEFKKGVLFKVEKTIPLENIQDLTFIENPLLSILELKILKIETAGNSNPKGSDMKLVGIIDAEQFKQKVLSQREKLQDAQSGNSKSEASDEKQMIGLLSEIRDLLKAQGS